MALPAAYHALQHSVTVEEYLKFEETAETKHEYADGKIIAMAGTSKSHNDIALNIAFEMRNQFGDRSCHVNVSDIRVKVSPRRYRYPDVVALCGFPEFDDLKPPCLLNPQVLVEVLSDSTERIDLITKQTEYRRFASVTDYVLIAQDRYWVMHYTREQGGAWAAILHTEPGDILSIASIGVSMTLATIYRRVEPIIMELEAQEDEAVESNNK